MYLTRSALTLFTLLSLASLPATAEIYKCTAGSGAVQYSDKPCAGRSTIITPAPAPAADAHVIERRQRADKLLRAYDAEHAEEQREQAEAAAALQQRQQKCNGARDWLARVSRASTLYRLAEDGSHVNLDDAEHAAALAKAEADVARWCD
jgi:response regulator RpfG family c-di-GMP phosphodiesterase